MKREADKISKGRGRKVAKLSVVFAFFLLSYPSNLSAGGGGASKSLCTVRVKNTSTGPSSGATTAPLVSIETVEVGDPNNASTTIEGTPRGAVSSAYRIGTYEVTINQYAIFLNAVATSTEGANGSIVETLYDSRMGSDLNVAGITRSGQGVSSSPFVYTVVGDGQKPITYVTWFNAARFANWMHNGGTAGADTETGAYTLNGATSGTITKNGGSTWWIPSDDEWFKAAYYKGGSTTAGYWKFPTQSDQLPGNSASSEVNQANFRRNGVYSITQASTLDPSENYLTAAGTFSNSPAAYGTFDQGGNVDEWTDTVVSTGFGDSRITRGGSWSTGGLNNDATPISTALPSDRINKLGFRLARSPLPAAGSSLSGDFDVKIDQTDALFKRINVGQIGQFTVRRGRFTLVAQDAVNSNAKSSASFTADTRVTYILLNNTGGQISMTVAPSDVRF